VFGSLVNSVHPTETEDRERMLLLGSPWFKTQQLGALAEHSADAHGLVDGLAAAGARRAAKRYLPPARRVKGACAQDAARH
jgi:hypothetical protein